MNAPTIDIKKILKKYHISPDYSAGQNFLIDRGVLDKIILTYQQYNLSMPILEIGPGLGVLTERLAKLTAPVIAIEQDKRLQPVLEKIQNQYANLKIVWDDILRVDLNHITANHVIAVETCHGMSLPQLQSGKYSIVANLPYNITSLIFRKFLTQPPYPLHMLVMVQKEVAERIVAEPGQLSVLALSVQAFAEPELIASVPNTAFYPKPTVDSALLLIKNIRQHKRFKSDEEEKEFFRLVKAGFAQRRKKLLNNLKNYQILGKEIESETWKKLFVDLNIDLNCRAQELSLEQWHQMLLMLLDKLRSFEYN